MEGIDVLNAVMSLGIGVQFRCLGYSILLPLNCPSAHSAFVGVNAFKYAKNASDATVVREAGVVSATPYSVLGLPPAIAGGTYSVVGQGAVKRVQCYNATVAYNAKNGKKEQGSAVWDMTKFVENANFEADKMQRALAVVRVDHSTLLLNIARNGLCPRTEIAIVADNFSADSLADTIETALRFLMPQVVAYKNKTIGEFVNTSLSMALAVMDATISVIPKAYLLVERVALYSSLKLSCALLKGMETGRPMGAVMVPWGAAYTELGRMPLHIPPRRVAEKLRFAAPPAPGPVFAAGSKSAQDDLPHVIKKRQFYAEKLMGTCLVFVCAADNCGDKFDTRDELHEHLGLNPRHKREDHGPVEAVSIRSRVVEVLRGLDKAQRAPIVCFLNGNNVSLGAKAGTGKSRVMAALIKTLKIICGGEWYLKHVMNGAATGGAAQTNGGGTMHSIFGLGGGSTDTNPPQMVAKFEASGKAAVVKEVEIVLCDEFVLLPAIVIEAAFRAIESTKANDNALVATQWFIAFDNKQLLCHDKRNDPPEVETWCKHTALVYSNGICTWRPRAEKAGCRYFSLLKCWRQLHDPVVELNQLLEDVRNGKWTMDIVTTIQTKLGRDTKAKVIMREHGFNTSEPEQFVEHPNGALILVMKNDRRVWINNYQLNQNNPNRKFEILAFDGLAVANNSDFVRGKPEYDKHFKNRPAVLLLAVGAPVKILRKAQGNMVDGTAGVVTVPQGTMGVIVAIEDPESVRSVTVVIDFLKKGDRPACRVVVERVRFECADSSPPWLRQKTDTRLQLPVEVAYCMTYSSFQGGEASAIVCDYADYADGWLKHSPYTGISRGTWGPELFCINLPLPLPNMNINSICKRMLELDDYIEKQVALVDAEQEETLVFSFDMISRLQVICYKNVMFPIESN